MTHIIIMKNNPKLSFNEKCYKLLKTIPKGKVTTYSDLAHALNCKAYRAVGNAMNKNPYNSNEVPCHRVVNSNGNIGGYMHDINIKIEKLREEKIFIKDGKIVDFENKRFKFEIN